MVSRRIFLIACALISALQLYRAAMAILAWPTAGRFAAAALRLTLPGLPTSTNDDGLAAPSSLLPPPPGAATAAARAGIAAVGLLQDGCMLPPAALETAGDGASVAALGAAALANGYYFLAAAGRPAGLALWSLEAAADGNGTGGWTPVGASAWRLNPQAHAAPRAFRLLASTHPSTHPPISTHPPGTCRFARLPCAELASTPLSRMITTTTS